MNSLPTANLKPQSVEHSLSLAQSRSLDLGDAENDPKGSAELSRLELTATAYHEAGHAVIAVSLGRPVEKVTIASGNSSLGMARLGVCKIQKGRSKATKDWLEDEVLILFAGMVAESNFTDQYCQEGAAQDLQAIRRLLSTRVGKERQRERLENRLLDKTEYLLGEDVHALAVKLVAEELLMKTTISGRAVEHFFRMAQQQAS